MKKLIILLVVSFALIGSPSSGVVAQITGGTVHGTVRNQQREPIAGVTITSVNTGTNQSRSTTTDDQGFFRLPSLSVGTYEITVEADKYQKTVQQIALRVNEDAAVDVELLVVGSNEQTTIIGTNSAITETSNSVLGVVIENKQINQLPLNGRNFLQLGALVANVNSTPALRSGAEGGDSNGPFAVAGQRDRALTFLVDGVDGTNSLSDNLSARISIDSIQEFKMITSLAPAEYGYHSGGVINILTKSGANDFHFGAFEFLRNNKLSNPNYFETLAGRPASHFVNNQFGLSGGGPLRKDSTFFFGNFEAQRLRAGSSQFTSVPTEAERNGIFTSPFTGQPVQIPVDPVSAEILRRYVPLSNVESEFGNYLATPTLKSRNDYAVFRVDHLASGNDVLSARYYVSHNNTFNPITLEEVGFIPVRPSSIPGFGINERSRTQNLAVAYTHNFNVQTINDLRFGYNRFFRYRISEDQVKPSELGFTGVARSTGLFFISAPGISQLGANTYPVTSRFGNFHIADSVSFLRGRHSIKAGGEVRILRQSIASYAAGNSGIAFGGFATFISPLADFILGQPDFVLTFERSIGTPMRQTVAGAFVQDDLQLHNRLVLNLGLRYELSTVLNSPTHQLTNFTIARGYFTPGLDTDTGLYKGDHNNFAPRVGFSWSITGDGRTVLRGGYGIFYDTIVHTTAEGLTTAHTPDGVFIKFGLGPFRPGNLAGALDPSTLFDFANSPTVYDENLRTPYAQHYNLTLQREFGRTIVLSLAYVGSRGTKLFSERDINQAIYFPGTDALGFPLSNFFNVDARRPTQLFGLTPLPVGGIFQLETGASSTYHSFQTTFNKRMGHGLSLLGAYTWSKSIDNATDPIGFTGDTGQPQNSNDLRQERARSVFDIAHQIAVGYTYDVPFKGSQWVEGWKINGIATAKSGQPFSVLLGIDTSLVGSGVSRPNNAPGAFIVKDGQVFLNRSLPLDPATGLPAAIIPNPGEFGNLGRNSFIGPGYRNVDMSIIKETAFGEKLKVQARFEMFNVFNSVNLALPERRVLDPAFGRSSKTADVAGGVPGIGGGGPRTIQLAIKLAY